ncbi:hypothetical protein VNI00_016060 [Paramarasmius palmivorus]|uniref:Uncharacterized protein n=1 Tax=Paramarasmius palmivorus TaxID=297713 RepID=A0AAW0BHA4_9AGAR
MDRECQKQDWKKHKPFCIARPDIPSDASNPYAILLPRLLIGGRKFSNHYAREILGLALTGFLDIMDRDPECLHESVEDFVARFRRTSRSVFYMLFLQEHPSSPADGELSSSHFRYIPKSGTAITREAYLDWSTVVRTRPDNVDSLIAKNEAEAPLAGAVVVVIVIYNRDHSILTEFTTTRGILDIDTYHHGYLHGDVDAALARCGGPL